MTCPVFPDQKVPVAGSHIKCIALSCFRPSFSASRRTAASFGTDLVRNCGPGLSGPHIALLPRTASPDCSGRTHRRPPYPRRYSAPPAESALYNSIFGSYPIDRQIRRVASRRHSLRHHGGHTDLRHFRRVDPSPASLPPPVLSSLPVPPAAHPAIPSLEQPYISSVSPFYPVTLPPGSYARICPGNSSALSSYSPSVITLGHKSELSVQLLPPAQLLP